MVSARKRPLQDGDAATTDVRQPPSMLHGLRNMWQFACLYQWLYIFGGVVKLDNLDIDELEVHCLSPHSTTLQDIGLSLLKFLSSHRGLTNDLFDEYTRRQYAAKAPERPNPFGNDEIPAKFADFDVFKQIRVLYQMTQFIMMNSEKLRDKMIEQKDADHDQTSWRIEPFGWDSNDRTYYVLDDNRIYRLTDPPPRPAKSKKNTKKARAEARRTSKRRRVSVETSRNGVADTANDTTSKHGVDALGLSILPDDDEDNNGLGGMKWECVAVTLDEIRQFLTTIPGKKDANEMILREKILEHLVPIIEQQEERRKKRQREREKELLNLERMAHAKRSSRIANRQEQQRRDELLREEESRRRHEQEVLQKEEQKRKKMEKERDNRLLTREKRLREREIRRAQHQGELVHLSEGSTGSSKLATRISERRREAEIEKNREALRELEHEDDEEWVFDCICGLHGRVDDGQHSVSCERCNIWQHSKCLGIDKDEADKDDFHFICDSCRRRVHTSKIESQLPVIKIKSRPAAPPILLSDTPGGSLLEVHNDTSATGLLQAEQVPYANAASPGKDDGSPPASQIGGDGVVNRPVIGSTLGPPHGVNNLDIPLKIDLVPPQPASVSTGDLCASLISKAAVVLPNESHNPFSTPHPDLSPPGQSPRKSHAYDTIYDQAGSILQGPPAEMKDYHSSAQGMSTSAPGLPLYPIPGSINPLPERGHLLSNPEQAERPTLESPVSSVVTPRLRHPEEDIRVGMRHQQSLSPPLPSPGALSPTKQSHVVTAEQSNGFPSSSPAPAIFPPTTALSPSVPKLDLTPPIKSGGGTYPRLLGEASDALSSPTAKE